MTETRPVQGPPSVGPWHWWGLRGPAVAAITPDRKDWCVELYIPNLGSGAREAAEARAVRNLLEKVI